MKGHTFIGLIIILFGLSILFHFEIFNFLFAIIILWIGYKVITGQGHAFSDFDGNIKGTISEDYLKRVLIFSGINTTLKSQKFEGMDFVMIFGGGELDASNVKTKKENIDIDLVAIFGGLKLRIPKGWNVRSEGVGIIGGFNNNSDSATKPTVTIHLKGVAIFGGVEVVN
jgi:predicted membrane protein